MYAQCSLQADRKGGRIKSWILWPHQRKLSWEGGGTSWYPPLGGNTGIVGTKPNVTSLEIPWCSKGVPLEKSTHPLVFAQFPQMSTHQSCKIMLATCEYCVGTEKTEHSCKFHLLFRLRNWPSCEPEASRTSIFIIAGHTEGSTKYLLLLKIWLSAATVLQRLLCHLSIYVTANHIFWVRFADANWCMMCTCKPQVWVACLVSM